MFKNIENNLLIKNNNEIYKICKKNNEINLGKFFVDILVFLIMVIHLLNLIP